MRQASLQPGLQVRWRNRVTGVTPDADGASLEIETPEGPYRLHCDWLVVCDGARSPIRHALGLDFDGALEWLTGDKRARRENPGKSATISRQDAESDDGRDFAPIGAYPDAPSEQSRDSLKESLQACL